MEWWNDMRMLCARYLVASEQVDRTGPVEEAVRSVGYLSGDEEELEDEEEEYLDGEDEDDGEDAYVEGVGHGGMGGHVGGVHQQHDAHRQTHIAPEGLGAPVVDRAQPPAQGRPLSLGATQDHDYGYEAHDDTHHVHNLPGHLHDADGDGSSVELEGEADHSEDVHHHDHEVEPPVYQHTGPQPDTAAGSQLVAQASQGSQGSNGGLFGYAKSLISGEKQQPTANGQYSSSSPKTGLTAQGYPDEKAAYKTQGHDVGGEEAVQPITVRD